MRSCRVGARWYGLATIAAALCSAPAQLTAQGDHACPDPTDSRSVVVYYVDKAYRDHATDPSRLPQPCLVLAIYKTPLAYPDSTVVAMLSLTDDLLTKFPNELSLITARFAFQYRLRRFADVRHGFDAMATADSSHITLPAYKLAIAAARRDADTTSLFKYLTAATTQFPTTSQFSAEYSILRQVGRLHALIDTVHRAMKADPRRTGGFASLASIYGNLEEPDSAFAYVKKGLAAHASRTEMATALQSLIGSLLRHAQINDAPDTWERTLPVALTADSVLTTPESKHLVALSIARIVAYRIDSLNFYLPDVDLGAGRGHFSSIDVTRVPRSGGDPECPSIATALRLVATAKERLASGGDKFAPETAPAIVGALQNVAVRLAPLQRGCATSPP